MFYFAYGSNTNTERARTRVPNAEDLGPATLSNWRVVERKTADIEPHRGSHVHGVLYRLETEDLALLDAYEGVPQAYERRLVNVRHRGQTVEAVTYVMTAETVRKRAGQPYEEFYRLLCWVGAEEHDLPNAFKSKRRFLMSPQLPNAQTALVTVYGTLLAGEHNAHVAREVLLRAPCKIRGTLFDTGWGFPTFQPSPKGPLVEAELLLVTTRCLQEDLDRLEGYPTFYNRIQLPVLLEGGRTEKAWVYVMDRLPVGARIIRSNSWRKYNDQP